MAFTGSGVITKVTNQMVRMTGASLASGASGTISQKDGTGDVKFPEGVPDWTAYADVSLIEAVEVVINPITDVSNFAIPIRVVKTGTTPADFLITLTNDEAAVASAELEVYVKFHS